MTVVTREWVRKAEADFDAVLILRRSRKPSRHDIIRFHCQQSVEKYLKARLQESGARVPRTHDLEELLKLLGAIEPSWTLLAPQLKSLSAAAVAFRYPQAWCSPKDARAAYEIAKYLRGLARLSLKLKA
jgi:HEPN domain-containing protein